LVLSWNLKASSEEKLIPLEPTPLIHAAISGDTSEGLRLIEAGADVNAIYHADKRIDHAYTALIVAAKAGHEEFVRLLLEHPKSIAVIDLERRTSSRIAPRKSILDPEVEVPVGENALIISLNKKHLTIAQQLINAGADIEKGENWNETLLESVIKAEADKNLDVIEFLVKNEAPIPSNLVLRSILSRGDRTAEFLVRAGADFSYLSVIDKRNKNHALLEATVRKKTKLLQIMLDHLPPSEKSCDMIQESEYPSPLRWAQNEARRLMNPLLPPSTATTMHGVVQNSPLVHFRTKFEEIQEGKVFQNIAQIIEKAAHRLQCK